MSTNFWHEQGIGMVVERRYRAALDFFKKAIEEEPAVGIHYSEAALALLAMRERDEALEYSRKGLELSPADIKCRAYRATILTDFNRCDEAITLFTGVIAEDPTYAPIYSRYGQALIVMGRLGEAEQVLRHGIALDPHESRNYYHLVRLTKLKRDDPCFQQLEALVPEFHTFSKNQQMDFHFAYGQALYGLGEADLSFEHLIKGNDIRHSGMHYEDRHIVRTIVTNVQMVDQDAMIKRRSQGYDSTAPIFIVSMPRAGSTLVEQVLASHPDVLGLEEHATFEKARVLIGGFPLHNPMLEDGEDMYVAHKLQSLGEQYVKSVIEGYPQAQDYKRFTDKSIDNYQHVGLMHLALPKARFIHVRRSILDTCLSIFSMQFAGLDYSYNLAEIGKYYRLYDEAMEYWKKIMPPDVVLEVEYETLVSNFEWEAHRIVQHCGLQWDDRCLSFHNTQRVVKTASNTQVRKPLYTSSLKRLRPSDELLKPLYDGLGPRLTEIARSQEMMR